LRLQHWLEADAERCLIVLDNAVSDDVLWPFLSSGGHGPDDLDELASVAGLDRCQ
jgi:hypothetical protein